MVNAVTAVCDDSVMANLAVTLFCINGFLCSVCLTLDLVDYYKYQLK